MKCLAAYEDLFKWDTSFYSVSQFPNNFPDSPLFTSLVFSHDPWNLTALIVGNSQVLLNNEPLLKAGSSLTRNKLESNHHANFTPVIYPIISVASIECPDSAILTDRNSNFFYFQVMLFKSVGLVSIYGSGFLSQVNSSFFR